jgi:hypothetical protein
MVLGVQVKSVERQNRWRPAWFLEIARSPAVEQLYVRGERTTKSVMFPLEYEFRVLQVLEANGILVPHVYGMCPDPMAIVMSKAPGRADLSTAANDDVRRSVMDHYIDQLAARSTRPLSKPSGWNGRLARPPLRSNFLSNTWSFTVNRNDARNRSWNFS